jgi:hypothetical protein
MAGLDIASGQLADHDSGVLPLQSDGPGITPLAAGTPASAIVPDNRFDPGDYGAVLDTTAMNLQQQAQGTAEVAAAMAAGMTAKHGLNDHYEAQGLPLGGHAGDTMDLPVVPEQATGAAAGFLYPPPPDTPGYFGGDVPGR